jgi:hypothetical protein
MEEDDDEEEEEDVWFWTLPVLLNEDWFMASLFVDMFKMFIESAHSIRPVLLPPIVAPTEDLISSSDNCGISPFKCLVRLVMVGFLFSCVMLLAESLLL